ncbi:dTDP-4-dehydrorhamnose reductase [bacterium A37T11]|nr:dTDP-4-dehydrorhamnose reductase [bacterium A37T11]
MGNIIVFGASGQLGQCLKKVLETTPHASTYRFLAEDEANILDDAKLATVFEKYQPVGVINCAAYTAVDKAEEEVQLAYDINANALITITELCKKYDSRLVQISTDFIFGGKLERPLTEEDETGPLGVYGSSKLEGEIAVMSNRFYHFFIIRTSWLYSEYGNNFVKTMLRLGSERDSLNVVSDQVGTPTYAIDLAGVIIQLLESGSEKYGTYHYSNEGVASWYDFAKAIFELSGTKVNVNPVPTSAYPTKAKRPAYSVLDKSLIKRTFKISIPDWKDSLKVCLERLEAGV